MRHIETTVQQPSITSALCRTAVNRSPGRLGRSQAQASPHILLFALAAQVCACGRTYFATNLLYVRRGARRNTLMAHRQRQWREATRHPPAAACIVGPALARRRRHAHGCVRPGCEQAHGARTPARIAARACGDHAILATRPPPAAPPLFLMKPSSTIWLPPMRLCFISRQLRRCEGACQPLSRSEPARCCAGSDRKRERCTRSCAEEPRRAQSCAKLFRSARKAAMMPGARAPSRQGVAWRGQPRNSSRPRSRRRAASCNTMLAKRGKGSAFHATCCWSIALTMTVTMRLAAYGTLPTDAV